MQNIYICVVPRVSFGVTEHIANVNIFLQTLKNLHSIIECPYRFNGTIISLRVTIYIHIYVHIYHVYLCIYIYIYIYIYMEI